MGDPSHFFAEKVVILAFLSDPNSHAKDDQNPRFSRVKSRTPYPLHTGTYRAPIPFICTPNHPPQGVLIRAPGVPIHQSYIVFKIAI